MLIHASSQEVCQQSAPGTPCRGAHTSCVVQMDPEPMPTLRASAPPSMRLLACRPVTTLPQMTCSSGCALFR